MSLYQAPSSLVDCTASTLTVTEALHKDKTVTLNRAAGITVTLPAAEGTGSIYRFYVGTTVTSNNVVIQVANATDVMEGVAWVLSDGAAAVLGYATGATDDTISLNGTTKGGYAGHYIQLIDVASGKWGVHLYGKATGTEATPFSAAVS